MWLQDGKLLPQLGDVIQSFRNICKLMSRISSRFVHMLLLNSWAKTCKSDGWYSWSSTKSQINLTSNNCHNVHHTILKHLMSCWAILASKSEWWFVQFSEPVSEASSKMWISKQELMSPPAGLPARGTTRWSSDTTCSFFCSLFSITNFTCTEAGIILELGTCHVSVLVEAWRLLKNPVH